ncbi:hypothetical protein [Bryobacter aggregatus]|uniref:hypothetical protein n=1 Tax=Bryobacter aggregatus TaxID=360054 RepID=UPI0004E1184C|nr:hypothetical protein [Bryobacter aggregatus]
MSFLDSLENNLKALESREEKDPAKVKEELERREADRQTALAAAPVAEALRTGPFTEKFLTACRSLGHQQRTMVRFTWLDTTLRLEAKEKRLDLKPTAAGVEASFFLNQELTGTEMLTLSEDPDGLAQRWLSEAA